LQKRYNMPTESEIKSGSFLRLPSENPFTRKKVGKSMHSMLDGTFLSRAKFRRALPFILFLMLLGVIYISNIFHVERTKRQIDDLEEELRELRYEYISSRSKLMFKSKPSEIAIKLEETGIRESMVPPRKIMVSKDNQTK
jgi:hypothetical protein